MTMDAARLQALADRFAIEDLIHAYVTASDTLDAELYASCFAEDAQICLPSGMVMAEGRDKMRATATANQTRFAAEGSALSIMRHVITNIEISLSGDTAKGRYYVQTWGFDAEAQKPEIASLGRYHDDYVRRDEKWFILKRVMHYDWGNDAMARQLKIGPHTPPEYRSKPKEELVP